MKTRREHGKRSGVTLVEVVLVAAILGSLANSLVESSSRMGQLASTASMQQILQEHSERALESIVDDLKRSGYVVVGGKVFPHVFDDGNAGSDFDDHDHAKADSEATPGEPDFGANREIVFVHPADANGDDRPDVVGSEIVWSPDEISYRVFTRGDGQNHLERSVNAAPGKSVCRFVERIVFDTGGGDGDETDSTLPIASVRVRVFLRGTDPAGTLFRHQSEVTVILRNGVLQS